MRASTPKFWTRVGVRTIVVAAAVVVVIVAAVVVVLAHEGTRPAYTEIELAGPSGGARYGGASRTTASPPGRTAQRVSSSDLQGRYGIGHLPRGGWRTATRKSPAMSSASHISLCKKFKALRAGRTVAGVRPVAHKRGLISRDDFVRNGSPQIQRSLRGLRVLTQGLPPRPHAAPDEPRAIRQGRLGAMVMGS